MPSEMMAPGPHRRVESPTRPDGGQGGRPHHPERGRRDVDGGVAGRTVTDGDGVAHLLVQRCQRRRAQDDLVTGMEGVARKDGRVEVGVLCARSTGTVWPSIWMPAKLYPAKAATSGSRGEARHHGRDSAIASHSG